MKIRKIFFISTCVLLFVAAPVRIFAADLVNINTADLATLETLPGVGPTIAQRIIDSRPYTTIEDISKVNGIGEPGSSSYEKIKDLITVGGSSGTQNQPQSQTQTADTTSSSSTTTPAPAVSPVGTTGSPPIAVHITGDTTSMAGGGSYFSGTALGTQGAPLSNVRYAWNFGDGTTAEGQTIFHVYTYPGKYVVMLAVSSDISAGLARFLVEVVAAQVALVVETDGSLSVSNQSSKDMDIGLWTLANGQNSFGIPKNTTALAHSDVHFAFGVTHIAADANAKLLYPNGSVAAAATQNATPPAHSATTAAGTAPPVTKKSSPALAGRPVSTIAGAALLPTTPTPASVDSKPAAVSEPAAVAESGVGIPLSAWLLGLAGLLVLGVAGAWYVRAHLPAAVETLPGDDEFDIDTE